jgi:NAD-specific glutamate dehydrogenase
MKALVEGGEVIEPLRERILGRVVTNDVIHPETQDVLFAAGSLLDEDAVDAIEALDIDGHWHAVARGSLREALYEIHRGLVQQVLEESRERDPARALARWLKKHGAVALHAKAVVGDIRAQPSGVDFASLSVALQAVRRLVVAER